MLPRYVASEYEAPPKLLCKTLASFSVCCQRSQQGLSDKARPGIRVGSQLNFGSTHPGNSGHLCWRGSKAA